MGDTNIRLAEHQGPVEVLAHLIRDGRMRSTDDMAELANAVQTIVDVAVEETLEAIEARKREAQNTGDERA